MRNSKIVIYNVIILLFLCFSCSDISSKNDKKTLANPTTRTIKKALKDGFYSQINSEIGLLIYQDNLYYFNKNKIGFTEDKFMLHLINKDGSFKNLDFFKDKYLISDSLKGVFKAVSIVHKKVDLGGYVQMRTGQFKRDSIGGNSNIWVFQKTLKKINDKEEFYKNQLQENINENLIQENFDQSLKKGKFFKINNGFYLLLFENELFVIADDSIPLGDKFMLHLIKEDNTFKNLSFFFKTKSYNQFLENEFRGLKIAKINIDLEEHFYEKIRVGQFNSNGNIWVQVFKINDIYDNPLLRYNNEFEINN